MRVLRLRKAATRRNETIRKELKVEIILDFAERPQLRWYGLAVRMEGSRLPNH